MGLVFWMMISIFWVHASSFLKLLFSRTLFFGLKSLLCLSFFWFRTSHWAFQAHAKMSHQRILSARGGNYLCQYFSNPWPYRSWVCSLLILKQTTPLNYEPLSRICQDSQLHLVRCLLSFHSVTFLFPSWSTCSPSLFPGDLCLWLRWWIARTQGWHHSADHWWSHVHQLHKLLLPLRSLPAWPAGLFCSQLYLFVFDCTPWFDIHTTIAILLAFIALGLFASSSKLVPVHLGLLNYRNAWFCF